MSSLVVLHFAGERAVKRLLQAHGANQGAPCFPECYLLDLTSRSIANRPGLLLNVRNRRAGCCVINGTREENHLVAGIIRIKKWIAWRHRNVELLIARSSKVEIVIDELAPAVNPIREIAVVGQALLPLIDNGVTDEARTRTGRARRRGQ